MKRRLAFISAAATLVALAAVAILSVGGSSASSLHGMSSKTNPANGTLAVRRTSLGKTLVDGRGRTLYLFEADRPNASNCKSSCLSVWPAFSGRKAPRALAGVSAHKIGTIPGPGGTRMITYAKHPLYYYVADSKPGDVGGEGLDQFGAKWYALAASGRKIDRD